MRVPYASSTPPEDPDTAAIFKRIEERRKPRPLTKLDLALLHNPIIADGWNTLLGAIRTKSSLSQADMELSICRIAVLNTAVYEWSAHAPLALKAGVTSQVLQTVLDTPFAADVTEDSTLDARQLAIIAFTDQSTKSIEVSDVVFNALRQYFSETQIVELTATVASYNMVSRFLVALDVTESNGGKMAVPKL